MRPEAWRPPVEPSPAERAVIKAVRRAKLFVFLREHRHELLDERFQAELAEAYVDSPKGQPPVPPVPPVRLALATILQAYTGVSDDEVIGAAVMDRRWQLVLDCMDAGHAPFAKGTLVGFRKRLIEKNLDRRLAGARWSWPRGLAGSARGRCGRRWIPACCDRVEDTINLMGHALRKALGVIAVLQGREQAEGTAALAAQAGAPQLAASSLKAAPGMDWDDPATAGQALSQVLSLLDQVAAFITGAAGGDAAAPCWRRPARCATKTPT
jgi:hypothetical protein